MGRARSLGSRSGDDASSEGPRRSSIRSGLVAWRRLPSVGRRRQHGAALERPHRGLRGGSRATFRACVGPLASSPDGVLLAPFSPKETFVALWEAPSRRLKGLIRMDPGAVCALASAPDGRLLAAGDLAGSVWVWAMPAAKLRAVFMRDPGSNTRAKTNKEPSPVWALSWSPDGALLASASRDATVLWDLTTGKERAVLERRSSANGPESMAPSEGGVMEGLGSVLPIQVEAHALAWSPDGARLASGGRDDTVRLWEPATSAPGPLLKGHTGWVWALAWSAQGRILCSGSEDRTVRMWDVERRVCLTAAHCRSLPLPRPRPPVQRGWAHSAGGGQRRRHRQPAHPLSLRALQHRGRASGGAAPN